MTGEILFRAIGQVSDEKIIEADTVIYALKSPWSIKKSMSNRPKYRRLMVACIFVVLCMAITIPVLAANVPAVHQILFTFSPGIAQFIMPERVSHENNGIAMEVVSADINDNIAEIYISLQDLTGNRIDATTCLVDSFSINSRSRLSSSGILTVGFDGEANTITYKIIINDYDNINTDKITFTVRHFISGRRTYDMIPISVDFSGVSDTPDVMRMSDEYGSGFNNYDYDNRGMPIVLVPSFSLSFGVDGFEITGMGYIDNMLHIQMSVRNPSYNFGELYFKDSDGNVIGQLHGFGFGEYFNGEVIWFNEMVFDIPKTELSNYDIYGYFVAGGAFTEGPWQVTFPLVRN